MTPKSEPIRIERENGYSNLKDRLEFILTVLSFEYDHAHTHSQRNSYMHVIRHEVEEILTDLTDYIPGTLEYPSDIPF